MGENTLLILILTVLFLGGSIAFGIMAIKAHNSGSTTNDEYGVHESNQKVPYSQIGHFWFSIALFIGWVACMFGIWLDK